MRHLIFVLLLVRAAFADELLPPQLSDIHKLDAAVDAITLADGRTAIYIRQRVDEQTHTMSQSLWRVADGSAPHAMEAGEPDGFAPMLSPDGKWILFLSTRPFADGTPAFKPVPPYSDPAADIWLIPVAGGRATPLGGKTKPYGRVITDKFYGRIAFSPDGRRVVFVADDGRDPRRRRNGRIKSRSFVKTRARATKVTGRCRCGWRILR